jgi:hypothetical protein
MNHRHYRHLLIMTVLSFVSMYVLMYAMVNAFGNVYNSVNQVYMAGLMTVPMVVIELVVIRGMYQDKRRSVLILGAALLAGVVLFAFIRWQTGVSDVELLRSMSPRHAGAILMCEQAPIQDQGPRDLREAVRSKGMESWHRSLGDLVHTVAFSHGPSFTSARQVEFAFGPRWAVSGAVGYRSDKLANHPRDRLTVNTCEV